MVVTWLWLSSAWAGGDQGARMAWWETLHDARLIEAVDGTADVAVRYYESLLAEDDLAQDDPLRGEVLVALGEARLALGQTDAAMRALRGATAHEGVAERAAVLLARMALAEGQVRSLPYRANFEDEGVGGWVRAGEHASHGPLRAERGPEGGWLAWPTRAERSPDRLLLAVGDVGLRRMGFRVRPEQRPVRLRVRLSDGGGQAWDAAEIACPQGVWTTVELSAAALRASQGNVRLIEVSDISGAALGSRGPNLIRIDDVEMR